MFEREIEKGIALLEAKRPGSLEKVQPERLDMASTLRCVLGQGLAEEARASGYGTGFGLAYSTFPELGGTFSGPCPMDAYGFSCREDEHFAILTEEWREALKARRVAA